MRITTNSIYFYFLVIFVSRERASIFLSFNECMRRMNCGSKRREECSEECADGN